MNSFFAIENYFPKMKLIFLMAQHLIPTKIDITKFFPSKDNNFLFNDLNDKKTHTKNQFSGFYCDQNPSGEQIK